MTATLSGRERMLKILAHELPDRVGLFEHFWGETLREDVWGAQGYPVDTNPTEYFNYDLFGGPWAVDTAIWPGRLDVIEETDEWQIAKDGLGAVLKTWKNKSGTPEHIDFTITSPQAWENAKKELLDPATHDQRVNLDAVREYYDTYRDSGKLVVLSKALHFEYMRAMIGDVVMLESMLLEPDWINDVCTTFTDEMIRHFSTIFDELGTPDAMFFYEDMGFSNGPFVSPKIYRELLQPHHKRLFDFFHDRGLPVIFHSCGNVTELVGDFIEAGIDCLQAMEVKAGVDIFDLIQRYPGKLAYMGNMDIRVWETNDFDKIDAYITDKLPRIIDLGVPYVFHSDHSVPQSVRFDTYKHVLGLVDAHGRYPS